MAARVGDRRCGDPQVGVYKAFAITWAGIDPGGVQARLCPDVDAYNACSCASGSLLFTDSGAAGTFLLDVASGALSEPGTYYIVNMADEGKSTWCDNAKGQDIGMKLTVVITAPPTASPTSTAPTTSPTTVNGLRTDRKSVVR